MPTKDMLLEVNNLKTYFRTERGLLQAVDDVSFNLCRGETLGIVGESGCGKSISCMSLCRIVESPPGTYEGGEIIFDGRTLLRINENEKFMISEKEMRSIRGNEISYIFQEPMTSLNPVFKIGRQLSEPLMVHQGMNKKQALEESIRTLELVRIPNAERVVNEYPFSLSGGMRQRAMIAMALVCQPKLLIADEPTTALDVTIQAQVLALINDLKTDTNASVIFITHDLSVIAEMSDRVIVMYAGKIVESAPVELLFGQAKHPYTQGLIASRPDSIEQEGSSGEAAKRLTVIPGNVPDMTHRPEGCPFYPRCEKGMDICVQTFPPAQEFSQGHSACCWLYDKK